MTYPALDAEQRRFILEYGYRARATDLAAVLGTPVEAIVRFRNATVSVNKGPRKRYEQLFAAWHGRPPADAEWPVPRYRRGHRQYEWSDQELAELAGLVGRMGLQEMADILTARIRKVTGDPSAKRTRAAVQGKISNLRLQVSDVVGGIRLVDAGRQVGSYHIVHAAVHGRRLRARRIGRQLVIPHRAWAAWLARRDEPKPGMVPLSSLRTPLGIRSDKLPEFARMGLIPQTQYCAPKAGGNGRGLWYIDAAYARQLVKDRRAGLAMPWHGAALRDNLRQSYALWQARRHPARCSACAQIWGKAGAPRSFEAYCRQYPSLEHGAKRHLTLQWHPGLTVGEIASRSGQSTSTVRRAMDNGALRIADGGRGRRATRSDVARWIARRCPTGEAAKSWLTFDDACIQYHFTQRELQRLIRERKVRSKLGTAGSSRGKLYVLRQQCGEIRARSGFNEKEAARRAGVTVERLHALADGLWWRAASGIPLDVLNAVIKRIESKEGYSIATAARLVNKPATWVKERIRDGTVRVSKAKWDRRRVYLNATMLKRLRVAAKAPDKPARLSAARWVSQSSAAFEAGVAPATLIRWAEAKAVQRVQESGRWRYRRSDVRRKAVRYWLTETRFLRVDRRPTWIGKASGAQA